MFSKKLAILVVLVIIAPIVLAACGATPEPETVVEIQTVEVEVTKVVEVEGEKETIVVTEVVEVEKEVEVTAVPEEPTEVPEAEPQTYRMGIFEDATSTNYWAILDPESSTWNFYVISGDKIQFLE